MISRFEKYIGSDFVPELLAIIPPGVKLSAGSTIDPKKLGKIPGGYDSQTQAWFGRKDCLEGFATDAVIREWSQYPDPNVGIRAKYFPGIDIDIDLDWLVADLLPIAEKHLGPSPVRGRDGSPRVMLMYRLAQGAEPIRTYCLKFTLPETADTEHAIEILGNGRSFVLEGRHSSGGRYEWKNGTGPIDYGSEKLSPVGADELRAFVAAVKDKLAVIGATIISGNSGVVGSPVDGRRRDQIGDLALMATSIDTLRKAIELIPCEEIYDRSDWLKLVVAAKAGCGGNEEFYDKVVLPWCLRYQKNTKDDVSKLWNSINDAGLGADYVYRVAREYDPSFGDDILEVFHQGPSSDAADADAPADAARSEAWNVSPVLPREDAVVVPAPVAAVPLPTRSDQYCGPMPKLMPADFDPRPDVR
jgi:hypothetical protein